MTEKLDEVSASLRAAQLRVRDVLLLCSAYTKARAAAGDEVAAVLAQLLDEAFTAQRAEGIAAASVLREFGGSGRYDEVTTE